MNNEQKLLTEYVSNIQSLNLWEYIAINDKRSNLVYCSQGFAHIFNCFPENLIGEKIFSNSETRKSHAFLRLYTEYNHLVMSTKSKHSFLIVLQDTKLAHKLYLGTKTPILHKKKNSIAGVITIFEPYLFNIDKLQIIKMIHASPAKQALNYTPKLTKREHEILFLLMHGYTAKQVTDMLHLIEKRRVSESAIKDVIGRLKVKFHTNHIQGIIQNAHLYGYDNIIPDSFILETILHVCCGKHPHTPPPEHLFSTIPS